MCAGICEMECCYHTLPFSQYSSTEKGQYHTTRDWKSMMNCEAPLHLFAIHQPKHLHVYIVNFPSHWQNLLLAHCFWWSTTPIQNLLCSALSSRMPISLSTWTIELCVAGMHTATHTSRLQLVGHNISVFASVPEHYNRYLLWNICCIEWSNSIK